MASPAPADHRAPGLRCPAPLTPDPELLDRAKLGKTREAILRELRWRLDHTYPSEVHPSNLSLAPGKASFEEMLRKLDDGLYVTDVTACFHGAGIDAVSGEYSMPATGFV